MQFLANENMPMSVILHLRDAGHDVLAAKESMRGETDDAIWVAHSWNSGS